MECFIDDLIYMYHLQGTGRINIDTNFTGSEFIHYLCLNIDLVASSFNLIASSFMELVPWGCEHGEHRRFLLYSKPLVSS